MALTVCDNYEWNGTTYSESGTYTYDTTAVNGCDSVATLDLTINNSSEIFNTVSSCDSYEWNGNIYDDQEFTVILHLH